MWSKVVVMTLKILSTAFHTFFDCGYEFGRSKFTSRQAVDFKIDLTPIHCSLSVNFLRSSLVTGSSMLVKILIVSWKRVI